MTANVTGEQPAANELNEVLGAELPPDGYRHAGWLYLNDDGRGPFFSELEQKSYLDEWPVFVRINTHNEQK